MSTPQPGPSELSNSPSAGLLRQLAAMIYDSLLIFAVLLFAILVPVMFNGGEAIEWNVWLLRFYLLLTVFFYYAWFWQKSGQTLGMRAWRIRVVNEYGANPNFGVSFLRFAFALLSWACLGLGYLWRLFKPYTWHDRLSGTRVVVLAPARDTESQEPAEGS